MHYFGNVIKRKMSLRKRKLGVRLPIFLVFASIVTFLNDGDN